MLNLFTRKSSYSRQISRCIHTTSCNISATKRDKVNLNFESLYQLNQEQLVYRVVELQRKLDSYHALYDPMNFDGRDKLRVGVPDVSDIIRERTNLRKIALKFVYTGWNYQAYPFEVSKNFKKGSNLGALTNSVERVFMEALLRQQLILSLAGGHFMERSGRTDKGVSGSSQVITVMVRSNLDKGYGVLKNLKRKPFGKYEEKRFDQREKREPWKQEDEEEKFRIDDTSLDEGEINYMRLLNEALPEDIRVVAWSPVSKYFSARHDCRWREYTFLFRQGSYDVDLMNEQASKFVGERDFRNFCKKNSENTQSSTMVRTMLKCDIERVEIDEKNPEFTLCAATIRSRGFFLHQIRKMMSVLFAVGSGYEDGDVIDRMLDVEATSRSPSYKKCVPEKLLFSSTSYDADDVHWRYDEKSLANAIKTVAKRYDRYATRADILKHMYQGMLAQDSSIQPSGALGLTTSVFDDKHFPLEKWIKFDIDSKNTLEEAQGKHKMRQLKRDLEKGNYGSIIKMYERNDADLVADLSKSN